MNNRLIQFVIIVATIVILAASGCSDLSRLAKDAENTFNEEAVTRDAESITVSSITYASGDTADSVTADFQAPTSGDSGTTITWTSSDPAVIAVAADGKTTVTRPSGSSRTVTLTATIKKGDSTYTKTITVKVLAKDIVYYTITFHANNGTDTTTTQTIAAGTSANLNSNTFTYSGYTFSGWATSDSAAAAEYSDAESYNIGSADISLYAVWAAVPADSHAVIFIANGGSGSMSNQIIEEGATSNLNSNAFTWSGHAFSGWSETAGGPVAYADGASYEMGSSDEILYAVWTAITHTITFYADNGSAASITQTIAEGVTANLNANTFAYPGHIFSGWSETAGGPVAYEDGASYEMGTANAELYAVWKEEHSITVDTDIEVVGDITINGGTVEIAKGEEASFFISNSFSSYQWYLDGDEISGASAAFVTIDTSSMNVGTHSLAVLFSDADGSEYSETLTIYVTNYLTITYDKNGGIGDTVTQKAAEGVSISLTANTYTFAGKNFAGWSTIPTGTADYTDKANYPIGSSNVTLYAVWAPRNIAVTSISPDGEQAVSADSDIEIVFSESLDGTTKGTVSFTSPAVTFTDGVNAEISFSTTTTANDTIIINPTNNLQKINYTSINVTGFKDSKSVSIVYSNPAYYFPVRGAMDLYFPFTNGSLEDASGRGVTLSKSGNPTPTAGHDGSADGAYRYDGNGDYFQVVGDLGIDCDADFTISCWVYIDVMGNFRGILSNYHAIAAEGTMLRINSSWNGHINALDLCEGYSNNNVISTGKWIHIVAVYEETSTTGSGTVKFYVDGVFAGEGATGYNVKNTAYGFTMGADYLCDARYFSGVIDEVRFYKYALSATEAQNLYQYDDIDGE